MIDSISERAGAGPDLQSEDRFENLPPSNGVGAPVDLKRARRQKTPAGDFGRSDRLPPHSLEAEQGVLGCILLDPVSCLPLVITKFPSDAEPFYDLRHQTVYANLVQMFENRKLIDIITVQQRLKDFQLLDGVGGIPYLNALQDAVPSAANLSYYLDIVLEKYVLRKMIWTCTDAVAKVYDSEGQVDELMDELERDVLQIRQGTFREATSSGMKESVTEALVDIEAAMNRDGKVTGIRTGFADLDKMTGGFNGGEMIVIAARPSLGKTSLAMNIADFVAVDAKIPVGVFSLEMTRRALTKRVICSRARVNLRDVADGFTSERDFPRLTSAAGQLSASPMRIDDTSGLSIMQLRARARMMWQMFGIKLFVVDYLQLLCSTTRRGRENRQQEVSEISSGIKSLAKELDVPVIVLSQLNRDIDKTRRKPQLSDLRESGSIEQDADFVAFLYNVKLDGDDDPDGVIDAIPVNLKISKQRSGPTGEVSLMFLKNFTRFESASKVSDEDQPEFYNQ